MTALTVRQPWASLIIHGVKDIENRDWATRVRGEVLIHSSAKINAQDVIGASDMLYVAARDAKRPPVAFDVLGVILGTVEIVDCVTASTSPWFVGEYGFVLRNPRPFAEPIRCRGRLGFWSPDPEIEALVLAAKVAKGD